MEQFQNRSLAINSSGRYIDRIRRGLCIRIYGFDILIQDAEQQTCCSSWSRTAIVVWVECHYDERNQIQT